MTYALPSAGDRAPGQSRAIVGDGWILLMGGPPNFLMDGLRAARISQIPESVLSSDFFVNFLMMLRLR